MKTLPSYNERVRRAYAGEAARRRLSELRGSLRADVTRFAAWSMQSGKPATPYHVKRHLARTGTIGATDAYVAEILLHVPDATAAALEFSAD